MNLGHLAQDCFHVPGGKKYDLLEEVFEWPKKTEEEQKQKHRKKEKVCELFCFGSNVKCLFRKKYVHHKAI